MADSEILAVIAEQLSNIEKTLDEVKGDLHELSNRMGAMEISESSNNTGVERDLKQICKQLVEVEVNRAVDRMQVKLFGEQFVAIDIRVLKVEQRLSLLWIGNGVVIILVLTDLITRMLGNIA